MKIFIDLATPESPVRKVVEHIFVTKGELEFVPTVLEADGIIVDEPIKAWEYYNSTSKRVAQVLWWKQKHAEIPESDRFRVFDILPDISPHKGLPGLIEAIAFLKGSS